MDGRVLVVDDEPAVVRAYLRALKHAELEADGVTDALSALRALETGSYVAVVTDVSMPDMSGAELLRAIRTRAPELPVILVSGLSHAEVETLLAGVGQFEFLRKPVKLAELCALVQRAVKRAARTTVRQNKT